MALSSPTSLVDALGQFRLLEPAQREEVARTLQARFSDPKALARELIERSWLTPYQANQLLQGRGGELLLGSYVLLEKLGAGGMGQVFKARNWKLGRIVALKLIRKERLDNPDAVRRFEREVRAAAALSHPNIVHALDADQVGGTHLLVMEYVEGTDLAKLVKNNGPLPVSQACDFIRQAALGLQHAYERGLVHRDIKPANLLLTAGGKTVKLLDMGLARLDHPGAAEDKSSTMTQEGAVMGTPDYIAPEQALESHTVDIRGDLYALGCTFYYLLTGGVPFPGGSLAEKLIKHQLREPQPLERFRPDVPSEVARMVCRLMAKKPEDRYQTPAEVAAALELVLNSGSGLAGGEEGTVAEGGKVVAAPAGDTVNAAFAQLGTSDTEAGVEAPQRLRRQAAERRWLLLGVAAGALVLVGLAVLWFGVLKEPGGKKLPGKEDDRPAKKTPEPVADPWLKEVAALPAEKQVKAVARKLKERNADFDGKVTPKIENGVVTELHFFTDNLTDISPVQALAGLKYLNCSAQKWEGGKLADLSPLKGMRLTALSCNSTQVSDLLPLKDMLLTHLECGSTKVSDLSPLKHMPLTELECGRTAVRDLSPLRGMKLTNLGLYVTPVSDLEPLRGMPLKVLGCAGTQVADLSPLRGMKLTELYCNSTKVSDLSPLEDMKLKVLICHNTKVADLSPLKHMRLNGLGCNSTPVSDLEPLRGMKLTYLDCGRTAVRDLSPLQGMKLTSLVCTGTPVSNLSPLKGMPLKDLSCEFKADRDARILRSIKTLETINGKPAKEFWKEVDDTKR